MWWHGPCGLAWFDGETLHAGDLRISLDERPQVFPTPDGWIIAAHRLCIRIRDGVVERSERHRYGAELTAKRGHSWHMQGLNLPIGARQAPSLTPFPTGRGAVWAADGFVYRFVEKSQPVAAGRAFSVGPHGALLFADRAAPPTGSARPIPVLAEAIRWRDDGLAVRGMRGDETVSVDLRSGEISRCTGVIPVSFDADLHIESGQIRRGSEILQWGVLEASSALSGHLLAGPGGVVWDLERAEPLFTEPCLFLGATTAIPEGFATVHWESGRGRIVAPTGEILSEFALPLGKDDVITGVGQGDVFLSAEGQAWGVDGVEVAPTRPVPTVSSAEIRGRHYSWNEEGRLTTSANQIR